MNSLDAEVRTFDFGGTAVNYYVDGPVDGRPIVLVHGGGLDSAALSWKETFPELAAEYRVYAIDLPGYGRSDPVPDGETPDVDYYAGVLSEFFAARDLLEVTLVGISLGGGVSLAYTLGEPARVSRLVLVSSYGLGGEIPGGLASALYVKTPGLLEATWWALGRSRRLQRRILGRIVHPTNVNNALFEEVYVELDRPNAGDAYRRFQRAEVGWTELKTDYSEQMTELPVPALFIHGKDDSVVPEDYAKRASDAAPVADRFLLTDCGHWPPREHPEAFVSRLQAWLEQ